MLFLAGQRPRMLDAQVRRSKFQYTPQPRFFEAAMKYVGVIEFPEQVDEVLHEAPGQGHDEPPRATCARSPTPRLSHLRPARDDRGQRPRRRAATTAAT